MSTASPDNPLVIAVDSSTTATKAIIVNAEGAVLSTASRAIDLHTPAPLQYEHDPLQWWTSTNEAVGAALARLTSGDRARIAAMAITHQRETFAPFDVDGRPLRRGILWLDGRATDQVRRFGSAAIHELSGRPADITPGIYKMAWLGEHEPEILPRAHRVADVHGYLVWNLTGRWATSVASADSLGLFDIAHQRWDESLLQIAGVTADQMPELFSPGEVIGEVAGRILDQWGLTGPLPLVAGLGDGQAAGLGAAAVDPDTVYVNLGTALVAGVHSPTYAYDRAYRSMAAGLPGQYVFEVVQNTGAYLPTWFRAALGDPDLQGRPDQDLEAKAAAVSPGSGGLLTVPYWNAVQSPHWDPVASGAMVGWRGNHERGAVYRSLLEGLGYEMSRNLRGLQHATGTALNTVRAMGGGVRSPLWRQIMTDCIGLPITACAEEEISALGAAVLAMASTGMHGQDVADTARAMASFGDVTEPDAQIHERYQEAATIQEQIYPALGQVMAQVHAFAEKYPNTVEVEVPEE